MKRTIKALCIMALMLMQFTDGQAWQGQYGKKNRFTYNSMPELFIKGRYLMAKDIHGNDSIVNMHGFGQTYSPYFNGYGWCKNSDGSVNWSSAAQRSHSNCLAWNKEQIDNMAKKGWKTNWIRIHMDPYWSNDPDKQATGGGGEDDISRFSFELFKQHLDDLFIPIAEHAIKQHQTYVVMRPPGVCPQNLKPGDAYQKYLIQVWTYVCNHEKLKNNPYVMFELANEPVNMWDGSKYTNGWSELSYKYHTEYFQTIIDEIRKVGCNNILWVPGLCWQQNYQGFVKYPIKDDNYGFAVHCYPGWYGSDSEADGGSVEQGVVTKGNTYFDFQKGWSESIEGVAAEHPILITEMDWAPKAFGNSWGKSTTGTLGGTGFGANFRYIMDRTGNVSWMLFTDAHKLAQYSDTKACNETVINNVLKLYAEKPSDNTEYNNWSKKDAYEKQCLEALLTSEEACPRMCYRWFEEYATPGWTYGDPLSDKEYAFPGTTTNFDPSIWENGTLVKNSNGTHSLITGRYGFGGWHFEEGLNASEYKYLIVMLSKAQSAGASLRLFDENDYFSNPYKLSFGTYTRKAIDLTTLKKSGTTTPLDLSHLYYIGFWSNGGQAITIDKIFLSNDKTATVPTAADVVLMDSEDDANEGAIYNILGERIYNTVPGQVFIKNGIKYIAR